MDTIKLYRDDDGEYRWKRQAENNEIVAASSEGYVNREDALDNIKSTQGGEYRLMLLLPMPPQSPGPGRALVTLFKPEGKYYTQEYWTIPTLEQVLAAGGNQGDTVTPYVMRFSPNFRRIAGGAVLVEEQEPWGYPHLIPSEPE